MVSAIGLLMMVTGVLLLWSAVTQGEPVAYLRDEFLAVVGRGSDGDAN